MEKAKINKFTLYIDSNRTSPYALFAYVALKEKGLPFETRKINIREKKHLIPEYQALSVTGKIPTLIHNDFALGESSAIVEYLEDAYPAPSYPRVLPDDIQQRARARQIQAWLRSDLLALREERPTTIIFNSPTQSPLSEAGRADAEKLFRIASSLVGEGEEHLFGSWCIADTELALMLNRLVANGDDVPEKLKRYVGGQWARSSIQAWICDSKTEEKIIDSE